VLTAQGYIVQAKPRYAVRVLKTAWQAQPHPDLAAAFAQIVPDETPVQRIKRFQALIKLHPNHRETRLLLAELYITTEDFPAARRALGRLAEDAPDVRSLTIMAAIERGEGSSDTVVKGWLARAVTAPRGPQWVCDTCNSLQTEWSAVCSNCESFDSQSWKASPVPSEPITPGSGMLPLIIGALEDQSGQEEQTSEADARKTSLASEETDLDDGTNASRASANKDV
jgi:HemY protein